MNAKTVIQETQDRIAAAGGQHIGDLASWNATHIDASRQAVTAIFAAEGFAHLVPNIEPAAALIRAVGEISKTSGFLVRPFARPHKDSPLAVGFYVQHAEDGESGDKYICGARVRITAAGLAEASPPEHAPAIADALAIAESTAVRANHLIEHAKTCDVSSALVAAIRELRGIPLRERGGFYLLPIVSCERWRRLSTAVEQLGFERILIEMHDAPSNVKVAAQASSATDVLTLIRHFLGGGTDTARALAAGLYEVNRLAAEGHKGADLILMTDGIDPAYDEQAVQVDQAKAANVRLWTVAIECDIAEASPLRSGASGYTRLGGQDLVDAKSVNAMAKVSR